jgi:hypothetical protein
MTSKATTEASGHEFPFDEGDQVRVRVREQRDSGPIRHEFRGECVKIREMRGPGSATARIDLDFGVTNSVTLRAYEAEFEVIDGE